MNETVRFQSLLFCLLLAAVIPFEYGRAFNFCFVGDDFAHILIVMEEKAGVFWNSPSPYHYYPLSLFLDSFPGCIGILGPAWFGATSFAFYLGCAILVMKIYHDIVGTGLWGNIQRHDYGELAFEIERNMVQTAENFFLFETAGKRSDQKIYLLNVPEHFIPRNGMIFYVRKRERIRAH